MAARRVLSTTPILHTNNSGGFIFGNGSSLSSTRGPGVHTAQSPDNSRREYGGVSPPSTRHNTHDNVDFPNLNGSNVQAMENPMNTQEDFTSSLDVLDFDVATMQGVTLNGSAAPQLNDIRRRNHRPVSNKNTKAAIRIATLNIRGY